MAACQIQADSLPLPSAAFLPSQRRSPPSARQPRRRLPSPQPHRGPSQGLQRRRGPQPPRQSPPPTKVRQPNLQRGPDFAGPLLFRPSPIPLAPHHTRITTPEYSHRPPLLSCFLTSSNPLKISVCREVPVRVWRSPAAIPCLCQRNWTNRVGFCGKFCGILSESPQKKTG